MSQARGTSILRKSPRWCAEKSAARFAISLTESIVDADLGMEVICVPGGASRVACSLPTLYFSSKNYRLTYNLLGIIMIGDRQFVAEHLFDNFVEDTSPGKLEKMEKSLSENADEIYAAGYMAAVSAFKADAQCKPSSPPPKKN